MWERLQFKISHSVKQIESEKYQNNPGMGSCRKGPKGPFLLAIKVWRYCGAGLNTIMKYKAYTYLLKFKPENKFYYGVRFKNVRLNRHPEDDFMIHYTTSSEQINNLIIEHGVDAFEWEIRKTFDTADQAIAWETKVLSRAKVLKRQNIWYNANVAGYKTPTPSGRKVISETHKDKPKSEEHKKNLSLSQKCKPKNYVQTEEHRKLNSEANSGKNNPMYGPCSEERAANISAAKKAQQLTAYNKNIPMTEAQKQKIRETKEKNKVMLTCEVCGKTMRQANFKQYDHGPVCKQRP